MPFRRFADCPLSLRKLQILLQLEDGRSYKRISYALGISVGRIKQHVREIAAMLPPSEHEPKERVLRHMDALLEAHAPLVMDLLRTQREAI